MKNTEIRLLRADEIECRVGTINERGLSLLLYKDARVDQKICYRKLMKVLCRRRNGWIMLFIIIGECLVR